jgi:hypothetical protein
VLEAGLGHGLKKAANQDLKTKKEVIPSLVSSFSRHKLSKYRYFLSPLKVFVRGSPYLCLIFSPGPVVTVMGMNSRASVIKGGSESPFSMLISRELKPD